MMKLSVCYKFCLSSEAQGAKRSYALKIRRVRKLSFLSRNTNILYLLFLDGTIVPQLLATQHSKYDFIEFKSPAARTPIPPPVTIIGTRQNPYLSVFSRCCVIQNHWFLKLENKFDRSKCLAFMSAYRNESFFSMFWRRTWNATRIRRRIRCSQCRSTSFLYNLLFRGNRRRAHL
jgi:hypothetical protein